ncbi:MAG: CHASE4 domain-containing protein [Armatimonadota bacterium]
MEHRNIIENLGRAMNAITEQTADINAKASDWAAWDDAYQFVQDGNTRFIRSNFVLSAFTGNNLNLIVYIRDMDGIVYGRWYQSGSNKLVPIPEDVRRAIYRDGLLTRHRGVRDSVSGILMLRRGPMLVASRPVVTSNE